MRCTFGPFSLPWSQKFHSFIRIFVIDLAGFSFSINLLYAPKCRKSFSEIFIATILEYEIEFQKIKYLSVQFGLNLQYSHFEWTHKIIKIQNIIPIIMDGLDSKPVICNVTQSWMFLDLLKFKNHQIWDMNNKCFEVQQTDIAFFILRTQN